MRTDSSQKVFTDLEFYLWRIRYEPKEEWQPEVFVMGSDATLKTIHDALLSMQDDFKAYGKSTRKFLCNPPEDVDVVRYAHEHQAELEWLIWLVVRMEPDVPDDTQFELKNKAVTIRLNERMLQQLLEVLERQLSPETQFPHGKKMPGGLFLASDWLEVE
ncbi:MAG: hypothetical protein ACFE8O_08505 [Candidatus Hermodarchaeota archaeon]